MIDAHVHLKKVLCTYVQGTHGRTNCNISDNWRMWK